MTHIANKVNPRRRGDLVLTGLGAGLLASQVALVVHGLTDTATWGTRPAAVVWAIWGLAIVAFMLASTEENSGGLAAE